MSTVTTQKVDTISATTNLTLTTGNTNGPNIVVKAGSPEVTINANATTQVFTANTSTVTIPTLNVTSALTANLTGSKTANGYVVLPNGIYLQWGLTSANSSTGNATFSTAFPTQCLSVTVTNINDSNVAFISTQPNTTVATIRTASTTSTKSVYYMAIGY